MKIFRSPIAVAFTVLFFIANCASSHAGLSTSNVPIIDKKYTVLGPVEVRKVWITFDIAILGIPLEPPPIDEAVTEAIQQKNADAIINIRYWNDRMIFLFLTVNRLGLNAEAVKYETLPTPPFGKK